ncbi:Gfo/Idh/MocA family protein [Kineococcus rhizosphaerae]|uniref:Putative dehydrogenase n=1 Tax=Kineococcus rhizosphaerae TaxID=559628 RepID=A0A2T0R7L9_9ACTN|nr:Gfo/Idh/MocA family oxidoreductase [Kineococcus rhizosphaerae]PRY17140.1 putative dehydrogenase [Kineococcus rhizosphaerae]
MSALRTAVVGWGTAGAVFHGPLLAADPEFSVDVVVTRDPARAAAARTALPGVAVVASPEEVWARRGELDLVVLASPPATHVDLATRALQAGLATVVDKPLAVDAAGARKLLDVAGATGTPLTVFQNRRWDGDFLTLRRLVAEGALGRVHRFTSRFTWWEPAGGKAWKMDAPVADGGGILADLGTHLVDQALQLFGPVDSVTAELDRRRPGPGPEDDAFVALHHRSGVRSHLWMSAVAALPGPRFHVLGERGAVAVEGLDPQEQQLAAGLVPGTPGYGVRGAPARGGTVDAPAEVPVAPGDYAAFYRGLADSLLRGGPLPVEPADAVAVLDVLDRVRAAA